MQNNKYIYLALGSNLGNRKENLKNSISLLEKYGVKFIESSPVYKTPALLLEGSPLDWNKRFLNCVIKVQCDLSPEDLLKACKKVEKELSRDSAQKWAPRTIDIDILFYKDLTIDTEELTIPHKGLKDRYFLWDALSFLYPEYLNPQLKNKDHQPVFMGILNITPDSFSDGGIHNNLENFSKSFNLWEDEFVHIMDIGAESTKPNAEALTSQEELERLKFVFEFLKNKKFGYFKPKLSIDTYHFETAAKALENGFDIINDVNAMKDERLVDLIKGDMSKKYILMHSLTVPTKKDVLVNNIDEVRIFLENKLETIEKKGISKNQIIFDFGFGFGKDGYQSIALINLIENYYKYGVKILVGHSRKSMLKTLENDIKTLDVETMAVSLKLANKVDIFRVHTPVEHQNALLAYKSV